MQRIVPLIPSGHKVDMRFEVDIKSFRSLQSVFHWTKQEAKEMQRNNVQLARVSETFMSIEFWTEFHTRYQP